MVGPQAAVTYLLVDGENIDATLGGQVLEHRPNPEERPRWERLRQFAQDTWGQPVRALFFLNATSGVLPTPFVRALLALNYRPIALTGSPGRRSSTSASSGPWRRSRTGPATCCWPATTATSCRRFAACWGTGAGWA
ncbi:hypothetical protein [Plantactinospora sp. KBS50]|uniref:hypothetical protein n=1 Tax=Plantactinospora sp. KBS50 TaxID=2024580 RepID=UPI001E455F71|nr:hypothetical protein [Plantactinospora sp. KBS50]